MQSLLDSVLFPPLQAVCGPLDATVGLYVVDSLAAFADRFQVALTSACLFIVTFHILKWFVSPAVFGATYAKLTPVDKFRWNEKLISVIHASIATVGAAASAWHTFSSLPDSLNSMTNYELILGVNNTPLHRDFFIQTSIGYFLSDLFLYTLPPIHHSAFEFFHHIVAGGSYTLGVYYQWGTWIQINFLLNEVSTPFLQLTWFFRYTGLRHSPVDKTNRKVFALLFFISRVVWNSIFCWHVIQALVYVTIDPWVTPRLFWVQVVLIISHCSLQYFWFYRIMAIALGASSAPGEPVAPASHAKSQ
ncbi:uncharacterized protein AMSG_03968 [Thecamonas trahens ATCC 50062]|uniref:TLC domain-containing protein n=1 Tax=Thecamonas trahens ATCC 50062 TaxID=461836 RepID=A0A0L0D6N5_THETB|nr:hypothetical protein AMSG_03968 [Thecamonas trahens ATCC 50062]KNC47741.1 hypothetical protein AMSG_03968 [Thecamonas trahens ATCC 50062]|eukprot:XP_013759219.1 hypothetical protein AMSG_03968 [Thecamonas trahens ATCC 50062]